MYKNLIFVLFVNIVVTAKCSLTIQRLETGGISPYKFCVLTDVKPTDYFIDISLDENPHFQYYNGTSEINFLSSVNSNILSFHLHLTSNIEIHRVLLTNRNSSVELKDFYLTYHEMDAIDTFITLVSTDPQFLQINNFYTLLVQYTVKFVENKQEGFFKHCYNLKNGSETCYVSTFFEMYKIRQSFPAFDNYQLRAHFIVKIRHRRDMIAISNMPGNTVDVDENMAVTLFKETPLMSTYILAFAVGKFDKLEIGNYSRVPMHLYTPIGLDLSPINFELYAERMLRRAELYLNQTFDLPKLDHFPINAIVDIVDGMEHWGFICYKANSVLESKMLSNVKHSDRALIVITHELVHQFFGNLVSMDEKEAFTTFLTYRLLADEFPDETYYMDRVTTDEMIKAFRFEYVDNTHEIISISRGTVFLNMINHIFGEPVFHQFIRNIIHKYSYRVMTIENIAEELKLLNNINNAIPQDIDITAFMISWFKQPSYPIVTVTRNYDSGLIEIHQNMSQSNPYDSQYNWCIPFNYATKSNPNFNVTTPDGWIKYQPLINITIKDLKSDDWVLFNKHGIGYYIVNYDKRNWDLIIADLSSPDYFDRIPPMDRAKLILDVVMLHQQGLVSGEFAERVYEFLKLESSYIVWHVVATHITYWNRHLYNKLKSNANLYYGKLYDRYGPTHKPNETRGEQMGRHIAVHHSCVNGYKKCIDDMEYLSNLVINNVDYLSTLNDEVILKIMFMAGFKNDDDFTWMLKYVNLPENQHLRKLFYAYFEDRRNQTKFLKLFVTSVYNLPLDNEDELTRLDLSYIDMALFHDIDILARCLRNKCYDFSSVFENVTERQEVIFKTIETAINNTEKLKFEVDSRLTIHDLLAVVDEQFGGGVGERIKAKYDVNKSRYN